VIGKNGQIARTNAPDSGIEAVLAPPIDVPFPNWSKSKNAGLDRNANKSG